MRSDREAAFERLCRDEYANIVRAAYLITGDAEEARDLAQEAFARAYERWRSVGRLDRPAAWVHRVAANLAISWWRHQRIRTRVAPPEPQQIEPLDPLSRDVLVGLRSLTPGQRTVVVLRYFADLSVEETARALGKRPGTVRALTTQALARLRRQVPRQEVDVDRRD